MRKVFILVGALMAAAVVGGCRSGKNVSLMTSTVDSGRVESGRLAIKESHERDSMSWNGEVSVDSMVYVVERRDSLPPLRLTVYGFSMSARRKEGRNVERIAADSEAVRIERRSESAVSSHTEPSGGGSSGWGVVLCLLAGMAFWSLIRRLFGCGGDRP